MEVEFGGGDGGEVGGEREFAGEVGADLVAVGLQAATSHCQRLRALEPVGRSLWRVTALGGKATKTGPVRSSVVVIAGPSSTWTVWPSARPL